MTTCGFTGTQSGMTDAQKFRVGSIFRHFQFSTLAHGDCIGADSDAHEIFRSYSNGRIISHPPDNPVKRAFKECDELRPEKPYLARNRDIVDESEAMIATPKEDVETIRSGTWSTVRYARRLNRPLFIVWPDGSLTAENYPSPGVKKTSKMAR